MNMYFDHESEIWQDLLGIVVFTPFNSSWPPEGDSQAGRQVVRTECAMATLSVWRGALAQPGVQQLTGA